MNKKMWYENQLCIYVAGRVLRKEDRCMKILRMIMVGGDQNFSSFYDVFCNTDEVFF